jgi:hypothetical protein
MANTRNCVTANNAENNEGNNNQEANLPRPLRLVLIKCWLCKHKCFRPHCRPWSTCMLNTKPPTFSHVVESMDADNWLKSIEKKLQVVQCNNHEKMLLASLQLSGPTADWWDAYVEAHEEPESINWPEF